jgi:hypothetical protein
VTVPLENSHQPPLVRTESAFKLEDIMSIIRDVKSEKTRIDIIKNRCKVSNTIFFTPLFSYPIPKL